ncbi:MAG TPA: hypothetical protein VNM92_18820 [Thermoanaerobaculia bacterium]|nr:hypothetical protein [Thermoanaerobaculia bacterium]
MTVMISIIVALLGLVAVPHLLLTESRRRRDYLLADASLTTLFVLGSSVYIWDPTTNLELFCAAFLVLRIALFVGWWCLAPEAETRWSPAIAALFAGAIYLLLVPDMLRVPVDGDEPYYVLVTESLIQDGDVDLRNQYRNIAASAAGRSDLTPQLGDPVGSSGEQYSRHQPFLSLLLIPGYLVAGLAGCVATIALFGALLIRSTLRLFEEEGISSRVSKIVFPFLALGPPILDYSTRIWPEVPAAFFFIEAVRGARQRRGLRLGVALLSLSLLKLRFSTIAVMLLIALALSERREWKRVLTILLIVGSLFAVVWALVGSSVNVHETWELIPSAPMRLVRGFFGTLFDGQAGILFQAPFFILGVVAIASVELSKGLRLGLWSGAAYMLLLLPRHEWHGGWSPPLRYIVVFIPLLALAAAHLLERYHLPITRACVALWTIGLVILGVAFPWQKFHMANGESLLGEALSRLFERDISRMIPSFIRTNIAALVMSVGACAAILGVVLAIRRGWRIRIAPQAFFALLSLVLASGFVWGLRPARRVQFEDAHVIHRGGELYPAQWTVARFRYRGGWRMRPGDSMSFLLQPGFATFYYQSDGGAVVNVGDQHFELSPTGSGGGQLRIVVPRQELITLRCEQGALVADKLELE